MAKLNRDPIAAADIAEFVEQESDFAFELVVFNKLHGRQFECEHGGTYQDPVTGKLRQFDLRATWTDHEDAERLRLAIECKHLRPHFPLLVLCVPRSFDEGWHDLILAVDGTRRQVPHSPPPSELQLAIRIDVLGRSSIYNQDSPVGKSCAQIGRDVNGVTGSDAEMFSKWTQAISSAQELARQACADGKATRQDYLTTLVMPVVVVPNGLLWMVKFNADGSRDGAERQVDRVPYFIDVSCDCHGALGPETYGISHLEFVTLAGLDHLINDLTFAGSRRSHFDRKNVRRVLGLPESDW